MRGKCENCNRDYPNNDRHKVCISCRWRQKHKNIPIKYKDKKCTICNEIITNITLKTRMRKLCDLCRRFRQLEVLRLSAAKRRVSRTIPVISNQQNCACCGLKYIAGKTTIHIDHVVPIALVRVLELPIDVFAIKNQQPLCKECHRKKTYIDYGTIAAAKRALKEESRCGKYG